MSQVLEFKIPKPPGQGNARPEWSLDAQPMDAWACLSPDGILYVRGMQWEWVACHPDVKQQLGKFMKALS